jgi:hypothetical protein
MATVEIGFHSTTRTHIVMRLQKSIPSAAKDILSKKGTYFARNISPVYAHFKNY